MRAGKILSAVFALAAALALAAGLAWTQSREDNGTFRKDKLTIETGRSHFPIEVEVATTVAERAHGLMCRRELAPDHGMLFLYPREDSLLMWMKNTYIPLDMLFIGADGRITRIVSDAKPLSTDIISSGSPAKAVLELSGGTAARLDIKEGDRIVYPAFVLKRAP